MRIEQLQSFVEIASSKSISIAAENLYITQPSLSRSMKLLEDELGLILFIRSSDGVRLTESGKSLLPTVQEILQQLDCLKQQADSLNAVQNAPFQNTLSICTLQSVADCVLVFAFEEIQQKLPSTEIIIKIPDNSDPYTLPDLSNYNLFIGQNICNTFDGSIKNSGLQMVSVFIDSFSIIINHHHPLAKRKVVDIDELLDFKLILHNYDFSVEDFYQKVIIPQTKNKTLNIMLRSNNSRVISQLLQSSDTVLITNNILAANDYVPNKNLITIPLKNFRYHCFCLFHPDDPQLPEIYQLIEILQNTRLKLTLNIP